MKKQPLYLTTAIPYANANPHLGHALEFLYADVMARYQRLLGNDVRLLTGSDEHGQKMFKTAKELGRNITDFANEKSAVFQNLLDQWNISNDDFIRTTEERHRVGAAEFWKLVDKNGYIYKKTYSGLYCVGCEAFKTEKDLVGGKCADHNKEPEVLSEENYFFKLSSFQKKLEKLFKESPDFVVPSSRYNEMKEILKSGLEDISISRTKTKLPWGIPVPGDETQVMYVWFDALTNYITALGYGSQNDKNFKTYWPAIHVIGKDINRFHSILWPAMLMAAGLEVPKQIAVHGFVYAHGGQKMSKTLGNVVDPLEIIREFPLETVRYFFMREIPFDNDGNYSEKQFVERYNGDLANGIGNLTNRVLTMIEKYTNGEIPEVVDQDKDIVVFLEQEIWPMYTKNMSSWRFDLALETVWKFIARCDQIISDRQPWSLAKQGKIDEVNTMLYHLAEALRHIAVMVWPVMPETAEKIFGQLGLGVENELSKSLSTLQQWIGLTVGTKINKEGPLFPRLEIK